MIKYISSFEAFKGSVWRLEIDFPDYTGAPINVELADNPINISYDSGSNDDPFENTIIPQSATLSIYSDGLDIDELQLVEDTTVECRIYKNDALIHKGFISSDGVQVNDSGVSYPVQVKSIDGLALLENITLKDTNIWTDEIGIVNGGVLRSPLRIIRNILYHPDLLNNDLPVNWACSLKSEKWPTDDAFNGRNPIGELDNLILSGDKSLKWYIENLLKALQSRLYQREGKWFIERTTDTFNNNGLFVGYSVTESTSTQAPVVLSMDMNKNGDLPINEDGYWLKKKPLGGVNVTYQSILYPDGNIIPNGNFDQRTPSGFVKDWSLFSGATLISGQPINGNEEGHSAYVQFGSDDILGIYNINLDTSVLYKNATMGVKWLPETGFDRDENGFIRPGQLWMSVKYTIDGIPYWLNEFGYWANTMEANQQVTGITYATGSETLYVNFIHGQNFYSGDVFHIEFQRGNGMEYYDVVFDEPIDFEGGVRKISDAIFNSGYPAPGSSNFPLQVYAVDNTPLLNKAYLFKQQSYIERINIEYSELKTGDVLDIQFQSKGKSSDIKIPEGRGTLSIEIFCKGSASMYFDDFYMKVADDKEIYKISIDGSKGSKDDVNIGISSAYSGFVWSSFMDSFENSREYELWAGKTLTQLHGENILNWRNKPKRLFNSSIDDEIYMGDFLTIRGVKYIVLNSNIDVAQGISQISAFEASPEVATYTVEKKTTADN